MKSRHLVVAAVLVVATVALATWAHRGAEPIEAAGQSPARELTEPLARAHAEAPAADSAPVEADRAFDPELATEPVLMQSARDALAREPRRTLALTETADRRFGPLSEPRRVLEIRALVALQMIGLSHSRAEHFYRTFPNSPSAREVERLTGYHPRPRGP